MGQEAKYEWNCCSGCCLYHPRMDIGGRGGYFPPLMRHSLGFGTHERGSRLLSPHPITPYQANTMGHGGAPPSLRPRPGGRGRRPAKATHKGRY